MIIRYRVNLAPGDIWALTCFVRDFAEQKQDHVLLPVTAYPEIFEGNPFYRTGQQKAGADLIFKFRQDPLPSNSVYPADDTPRMYGADGKRSMCSAFYEFLQENTGIKVEQRTFAAECYFSDFEKQYSIVPVEKPVCIINAGYKDDVPVKNWGYEKFQAVVDALKDKILFVQVGANRQGFDYHRPLAGALNMIGKTSLRDLALLVYHADFVLTGISQLHHLAGIQCYKPRHCITIAGARELENWANCYKRQGVTWHWISRQDCAGNSPGCWRSRCKNCSAMDSIHADEIISILEDLI